MSKLEDIFSVNKSEEEKNINTEEEVKEEPIMVDDLGLEEDLPESEEEVTEPAREKTVDEKVPSEEEEIKETTTTEKINVGEEPVKEEKEPKKKKEEKSNVIDLSTIQIENFSGIDAINNLSLVRKRNNKAHTGTTQTAAIKSGYLAHMRSLTFLDTLTLDNSDNDPKEFLRRLYQVIHSKIQNTSIGEVTYEEFLSITALEDINHLVYGIFSQTYKTDNSLNITCNSCGKSSEIQFDKDALIHIEPEDKDETYERMLELLQEIDSIESIRTNSMINKPHPVLLEDSGLIFVLKLPTLKDQLDVMNKVNVAEISKIDETGTIDLVLMHTESILIPNLDPKTGEELGTYSEVKDIIEVINFFRTLSGEDGLTLASEIGNLNSKYNVSYAIDGISCPKCSTNLGKIEVDMTQLLFLVQENRVRKL